MLLKIIKKSDEFLQGARGKPYAGDSFTILKKFGGHDVVFDRGTLRAVPCNSIDFEHPKLTRHMCGNTVKEIVFKIIASLKSSSSDAPQIVDYAYGYRIIQFKSKYFATDSAEISADGMFPKPFCSENLEELYDMLYREHLKQVEVYVHTGLPKTGTTFLQAYVFPNLKGVHYIEKDGVNDFFNKFFVKVRFGNHLVIAEEIKQQFLEYVRYVDEKKILISEEALSEPRNNGRHFLPNTYILKEIFPSVKILFTIRNQIDFLESFYLQDLKVGGCLDIDNFLRYDRKKGKFLEFEPTLLPKLSVHYLDYSKFIDYYFKLFGEKNVKIMVYEKFQSDKNGFIRDLCRFMDTDISASLCDEIVHKSYNYTVAKLALVLNRLTRRGDGRFGIIIEKPFVEKLSKVIDAMNQKLKAERLSPANRIVHTLQRNMLRILRRELSRIEVAKILDFIDSVFGFLKIESPKKFIDSHKRRLLKELYSEMNERLDKRYHLDLKKYKYYE